MVTLLQSDPILVAPHAIYITEKRKVDQPVISDSVQVEEPQDIKKVIWSNSFITWISPEVVQKLVTSAHKKKALEVEVSLANSVM